MFQDTSMFLLSGVLSLLLCDMGARLSQPVLRWLALTFSVTSCSELLYVLTSAAATGHCQQARDRAGP
jgi:hypothetical protein